jgi:hypothetical protein
MGEWMMPPDEWEAMGPHEQTAWMTRAAHEMQLPPHLIERIQFLCLGDDPTKGYGDARVIFGYRAGCTCGEHRLGWRVQVVMSWGTVQGWGDDPLSAMTMALDSPIPYLN